MNMRKEVVFLLGVVCLSMILSFASTNASAQVRVRDSSKTRGVSSSKFFFGGSIGFTFGSYTYVNISPVVGYRFTPRWTVGVGGTFQYYKTNSSLFNNTESIVYGGSGFVRYMIVQDIGKLIPMVKTDGGFYLHTEYEALSLETSVFDQDNELSGKRYWARSVLVGGGFRQQVGRRAYLFLELLWNLTYDSQLPYNNPLFRVGFTF